MMKSVLQLVALLVLLTILVFEAAEAQVYVSLTGDNSDGTTWEKAYQGIAIGVTNAVARSQDIYVAEGSYQVRARLDIPVGISLYGGFPDTGEATSADRDAKAYPTILDAHGTTTHILYFKTAGGAVVDGFTFTNAQGGASIYMDSVPVSVRDCMFAANRGGAGSVTLYRSNGGEIKNCFFKDNEATNGAGVAAYGSGFSVDSSVFIDNYVTNTGGGIESHEGSDALITNCIFAGNKAGRHGGGVRFDYMTRADIVNCTFVGNECDIEDGGGIVLLRSGGSVVNCIFSRNTRYALCFVQKTPRPAVMNCLFHDNPDGVYKNDVVGILLNAEGAEGINELPECSDNIDGDPLFNNAGNDDYYLQAASPAIDSGSASGAPSQDIAGRPRPFDYDGNGEQVAPYDMGAYEYEPGGSGLSFVVSKPVVYVSLTGDNTDGRSWATAYTTIAAAAGQALIRAADIYLAAGTYPVDARLDINLSVSWYGGFPPEGEPAFADRNPDQHETVLDGQGLAPGIIRYSSTTGIAFDGITVANGASAAAALYFNYTSAKVANCRFLNNAGGNDGGGLFGFRCTNLEVSRCFFAGNSGRYGAGVGAYWSRLYVDRCAFLNNSATYVGAGLESHEGDVTVVTNSVFAHNTAYLHGGAIRCDYTDEVIIANCTIVDNSCTQEYGGGIMLLRSGGVVSNCILAGNNRFALWFVDHEPRPSIFNSQFYDNEGVYKNDDIGEIEGVTGPLGINALVPEVANNQEGDPFFVDAEQENYHLAADSPCVDTGTWMAAPLWDYDGTGRPIAIAKLGIDVDTFDIGAYEFTGEELEFGLLDADGGEGEGEGEDVGEGEGEGEGEDVGEGEGEGECEGEGEGEDVGEGEGEDEQDECPFQCFGGGIQGGGFTGNGLSGNILFVTAVALVLLADRRNVSLKARP